MTLNELRNVVREMVVEAVSENYAAMQHSDLVGNIVKQIQKEFRRANSNRITFDTKYEGIHINITAIIEGDINEWEEYGGIRTRMGYFITFHISQNSSTESLFHLVEHELTHFFDKEKEKSVGYKNYEHTFSDVSYWLTDKYENVADVFYMLWDTSEFNAYQASRKEDLDKYIQELTNTINYCEKAENPELYNLIKEYFSYQFGEKWDNAPLWKVRNYFLRVSKDRLQKFIKKVKRVQNKLQ